MPNITALKGLRAYLVRFDPQAALDVTQRIAQLHQTGDLDSHPDQEQARTWWKKAIQQGLVGEELDTACMNVCAINQALCVRATTVDEKKDALFRAVIDFNTTTMQQIDLPILSLTLGRMCEHVATFSHSMRAEPAALLDQYFDIHGLYQSAAYYYELAATMPDRQGDFAPARAAHALGLLYANGFGVEHSLEQAAKLYEHAALAGLGDAMVNLAEAFHDGRGVEVSLCATEQWLAWAIGSTEHQGCVIDFKAEWANSLLERVRWENKSPYPSPQP